MALIDVGQQTNDDIFNKIKQLIDSDCETIVLTNCSSITPPESDTAYEADVVGFNNA